MISASRAELAAAIRAVNAAFARLPQPVQGSVDIAYDGIEEEIDASVLTDDCERALSAIRAWRGYWLDRFERAAK